MPCQCLGNQVNLSYRYLSKAHVMCDSLGATEWGISEQSAIK